MTRREAEALLCDYSHRLHARGWVANHDGNVTMRLDAERYLATPTGVSKAAITREVLIVVDGQGKRISGLYKPFSEIDLHLYVYRQRPDVRVVLHAHPPAATGLAVAGLEVRTSMMAEPVVSLGAVVPLVRYARPKTPEQTQNLAPFVADADVLLLESHGVLSYGPDLETAYLRMELCEHLAKIQLAAMQAGRLRDIPAPDVQAMLEARTKAGLGAAARAAAKQGAAK
jgi:L-fuculose-phosphate aldolase